MPERKSFSFKAEALKRVLFMSSYVKHAIVICGAGEKLWNERHRNGSENLNYGIEKFCSFGHAYSHRKNGLVKRKNRKLYDFLLVTSAN